MAVIYLYFVSSATVVKKFHEIYMNVTQKYKFNDEL